MPPNTTVVRALRVRCRFGEMAAVKKNLARDSRPILPLTSVD